MTRRWLSAGSPSAVRLAASLAAASIVGAIACGDNPVAPTPSPETPIVTPQVATYTGVVGPGGSATRTFAAQLSGTATAVLSDIAPATALTIGLGIPAADGRGCLLARSATAVDGEPVQVTAAVDAGSFCVQTFAPPAAADAVSFTVTLVHP